MKLATPRAPITSILLAPIVLALASTAGAGPGVVTAYENGAWFDGEAFVPGARYVVDGVLRTERPARVDAFVDLDGRCVVPPYGEAHAHFLEPDLIEEYVRLYLSRGVFYVKAQAGVPSVRRAIEPHLNRPDGFDFVSANQGFTGPGGHPLQILGLAQRLGALPPEWTEDDFHGPAIFVVETEEDVARAFPRFLADRPDFVKIFLHYSERHEDREGDPRWRYQRALDPALAAPIVERARAAGLQVSAHGFTAADFRTAVAAGADHLAHFPGTGFVAELGVDSFLLTDEDASAAAARGVTVATAIADLVDDPDAMSAELEDVVERVLRPNLERLRAAGVPVLIGTDGFRETSDVEARTLSKLGLFDNRQLLRAWCIDTPRAIFPERRVGRLDDGSEASFLVLDGDPLQEFEATQRIVLRVKDGTLLLPREPDFPPLR